MRLQDSTPGAVAAFDRARIEELLQDAGIVRNRLKVESTSRTPGVCWRCRKSCSFSAFLWDFVDGEPLVGGWTTLELPAETPVSKAMSKELKRRGFPLRRAHGLLRLHAGGRARQRPRRLVLPVGGGAGNTCDRELPAVL